MNVFDVLSITAHCYFFAKFLKTKCLLIKKGYFGIWTRVTVRDDILYIYDNIPVGGPVCAGYTTSGPGRVTYQATYKCSRVSYNFSREKTAKQAT